MRDRDDTGLINAETTHRTTLMMSLHNIEDAVLFNAMKIDTFTQKMRMRQDRSAR